MASAGVQPIMGSRGCAAAGSRGRAPGEGIRGQKLKTLNTLAFICLMESENSGAASV